ncbi:hypothetical protein [Sphingomonas koreensis]|uniref:hypothetical protein n=1 Tax=Sphingomonas koreensis TaxID=93064 RepID=UPI000F7E595F|nr:hypothetical protein [Sphingomonas koreensis]
MLTLAALFVATSISGAGQGAAPAPVLQPGADSTADRTATRTFSRCLAQARPRWAREVLAQPYLSKGQTDLLETINSGHDNCSGSKATKIVLRHSSIVAGLAEALINEDLARVGLKRVSVELNRLPSRNASEDFALCVVARRSQAAKDLVTSTPGSDAERIAGQQLALGVKPCTNPGETGVVDLQSLRALAAAAIYRGVRRAADPSAAS